MKESLVDLNFSFPTNNQSSEVLQPGKSTLNLPSTPVTPQFATILIFLGLIVFTVGTDQFNAAFQQPFAKRITVVPLIRYDADRILPRPTTTFSQHRNLLNSGFQQFYFTRRGRIKMSTDRDSLALDHHHPLCTLPAFGLSNAWAPFFAEAKLPSAKVSSQSNWPCWSSSDRNLGHILSQTPCSSHCCNLGQQVLADGYRSAKSFHLAPLGQTQIMPSNTTLLPLGFRPPFGEGLGFGSKGSSLIHCSSVINGFSLAIKSSFLDPTKTRPNSFRCASLHCI